MPPAAAPTSLAVTAQVRSEAFVIWGSAVGPPGLGCDRRDPRSGSRIADGAKGFLVKRPARAVAIGTATVLAGVTAIGVSASAASAAGSSSASSAATHKVIVLLKDQPASASKNSAAFATRQSRIASSQAAVAKQLKATSKNVQAVQAGQRPRGHGLHQRAGRAAQQLRGRVRDPGLGHPRPHPVDRVLGRRSGAPHAHPSAEHLLHRQADARAGGAPGHQHRLGRRQRQDRPQPGCHRRRGQGRLDGRGHRHQQPGLHPGQRLARLRRLPGLQR